MNGAGGFVVTSALGMGAYFMWAEPATLTIEKQPASVMQTMASVKSLPQDMSYLVGILEPAKFEQEKLPENRIVWHVSLRGHEFGRFIAQVKPDTPTTTKVSFDFEDVTPVQDDEEDEFLKSADFDYSRTVAEMALAETLTAKLENREFDKKMISDYTQAYIMANPKAFTNAVGGQARAAFMDVAKQMEAMDSTGSSSASRPSSRAASAPMTSAEPMTDLSGYSEPRRRY